MPRPASLEDRPARRRVVAVEAHHDRPGDLLTARAEHAQRRQDAVRHRVTGGDAAEYVDQHAAHARVGQHYLQAVGHDLGRGAAADVEEVRRRRIPPNCLAGQRHHIEGGHDQPGTVADDAHLPLELDVVEVLGPGPRLDRVRARRVGEPFVVLPECRIVVEGDFAVESDHLAAGGEDQRVDLDKRGVLVGEDGPEPLRHGRGARGGLGRQPALHDDLGRLDVRHPGQRVDHDLGDRAWARVRDLLDLHAALHRADGDEGACRPVHEEGQVELAGDVAGLLDQDRVHPVALDVHAEDLRRPGLRLAGSRPA